MRLNADMLSDLLKARLRRLCAFSYIGDTLSVCIRIGYRIMTFLTE